MSRTAFRAGRCLLLSLLVGALGAGCGGKALPKTYPVRGKAVAADGHPLSGGTIYFQSDSYPALTISAVVEPDGKFSIKTARDKAQVEGAPEGAYRVLVTPPTIEHKGAPSVTLPSPYTVEAKENTLDIDLGKVPDAGAR